MRTTTLGLLLALMGCGDAIDGHSWSGTCADDNGTITIATGELALSDAPISGLEGEHEHYRGNAVLTFPGAPQDASVAFALCTDENGCEDPLNDFPADSAVIYFTNAAGELAILGKGEFDGKKALAGNCSVYGSANVAFALEQSE